MQHGNTEYVPAWSLRIAGWAPEPGWSFGIGARSGMETDIHRVRALSIEVGALVGPSAALLSVSLNSQQFVSVGDFIYYASPNVTLLSPTTGPVYGAGPAVMLAGAGWRTHGSLAGGSHYRCRFGAGSYVSGTASAHADEVYCVAPAGGAAASLPVALSLNAQQYHAAPSNFSRLTDADVSDAASPVSGPVGGGTLVTIAAAAEQVASGDAFRCRFSPTIIDTRTTVDAVEADGLIVTATYHPSNDSALCLSPPVSSAAAAENATLQFAFDGLHFAQVTDRSVDQECVVCSEKHVVCSGWCVVCSEKHVVCSG